MHRTDGLLVLLFVTLIVPLACSSQEEVDKTADGGVEATGTEAVSKDEVPDAGPDAPLSVIELESKAEFFSAESGDPIRVEAGIYTVHPFAEAQLLLERDDGLEIVVPARVAQHEDDLEQSIAASEAPSEDEIRIALFRPDGSVLEALGSHSGVVSRGRDARRGRYALRNYQKRTISRSEFRVRQKAKSRFRTSARYPRPTRTAATPTDRTRQSTKVVAEKKQRARAPLSVAEIQPPLGTAAGSMAQVVTSIPATHCNAFEAGVPQPYSQYLALAASAFPAAQSRSDFLDIDRCGRIIARSGFEKIAIFDHSGQKLHEFGGRCRLSEEWDAYNCKDPDGDGPLGPGDGQISSVAGITVGSLDRIYVTDHENRRIVVFDWKGRYLFSFGSDGNGPGQLKYPRALEAAPDGKIFVEDYGNARIQIFNPDGSFHSILAAATPKNGFRPRVIIKNGRIYVKAGCSVKKLDLAGNQLFHKEHCSGYDAWSRYEDFDVDGVENFYFMDQYTTAEGNRRASIDVFDGNLQSIVGNYSTIYNPWALKVDTHRNFPVIYIATKGQGATNLLAFDARQFRDRIEAPVQIVGMSGGSVARLQDPNDLHVGTYGLYVLDRGKDRLVSFKLGGQYEATYGYPFDPRLNTNWSNNEMAILVGKYIIAEAQTGKVVTRDFQGNNLSEFSYNTEQAYTKINAIEVDNAGNIILAGTQQGEIEVFDSAGTPLRNVQCNAMRWGPVRALEYDADTREIYAATRDHVVEIDANWNCRKVPEGYHGIDGTFSQGGYIQDIATDDFGRIYVLQDRRVQVFTRDWQFIRKFGGPGTGPGEMSNAVAIDTDRDGRIYVLQSYWGYTNGIRSERYQVFDLFDNSGASSPPSSPSRSQTPSTSLSLPSLELDGSTEDLRKAREMTAPGTNDHR